MAPKFLNDSFPREQNSYLQEEVEMQEFNEVPLKFAEGDKFEGDVELEYQEDRLVLHIVRNTPEGEYTRVDLYYGQESTVAKCCRRLQLEFLDYDVRA